MKKLVTLFAMTAMIGAASAASFSWGTDTAYTQFPAGTRVSDGSAMGYLVYLGNTGSETYTIDGFAVTDPSVQNKASASTGFETFKGRINDAFEQGMGTTVGGTSDTFNDGAVFGMYIIKDGWINIAANTYTIAGLADDTSTLDKAVFTFDWTQNAPGDAPTPGGGWYAPVPEPATAALALAGLAMLIRRRK